MMFGWAFGADVILFFCAFVYFAVTDKDALRSERFGIQKMAIEKGYIGDSMSGLFLPEETLGDRNQTAVLPPSKQIEQQK